MIPKRNKDIRVSTELAEDLLQVLEKASGKRAKAYAKLLKAKIKEGNGAAGIQLSLPTVAVILKFILMAMLPDPFVHGIMMMLEKL